MTYRFMVRFTTAGAFSQKPVIKGTVVTENGAPGFKGTYTGEDMRDVLAKVALGVFPSMKGQGMLRRIGEGKYLVLNNDPKLEEEFSTLGSITLKPL